MAHHDRQPKICAFLSILFPECVSRDAVAGLCRDERVEQTVKLTKVEGQPIVWWRSQVIDHNTQDCRPALERLSAFVHDHQEALLAVLDRLKPVKVIVGLACYIGEDHSPIITIEPHVAKIVAALGASIDVDILPC